MWFGRSIYSPLTTKTARAQIRSQFPESIFAYTLSCIIDSAIYIFAIIIVASSPYTYINTFDFFCLLFSGFLVCLCECAISVSQFHFHWGFPFREWLSKYFGTEFFYGAPQRRNENEVYQTKAALKMKCE